ncbi:PREDICTED: uncharacterized protein LOC109173569 [Ipomoea nil]|uniref:uncharacterized protein LOC109173569 n=1 Tax=Ipomoea nil TaxID=35883 RepID=UPI0009015542|nr:PREDICTED: uncharacterized protein LOC109173569 [Ipomoea nil]
MMITEATDAILCRGFFATLDGQAHDWFGSLSTGSISTFPDLTRQFLSHFATSIQRKKQIADLCDLKQGSSESLAEYLSKWKKEAMGVADFDGKSAMVIFRNNLRSGAFHQELIRYPPRSYTDLMDKAARYADAEAAGKRKKEQEEGRGRKDKAPQEERKAPRPHRREYAEGPKLNSTRYLTPLTQPVGTILAHAEDQEIVRQIEELIQMGYLGQFIKRPGQAQGQKQGSVWRKGGGQAPSTSAPRKRDQDHSSEEEEKTTEDSQPPEETYHLRHLQGARGRGLASRAKEVGEKLVRGEVTRTPHEKKPKRESITFTDADLPDGPLPHRNALVVKLDINNVVVHRVLVDTGSLVNVMYYDTFTQLGLSRGQLEQVRTPPVRVHGRLN